MTLQIYTDGSSSGGGSGCGGWAWWLSDSIWSSGGHPDTTNNRMELTAMLEAMLAFYYVNEEVEFISDSQYVINTINQKWWRKWERNHWHTSAGTPVANQDLWRRIAYGVFLYGERPRGKRASYLWVKGHKGNHGNESADRLAGQARKKAEAHAGS